MYKEELELDKTTLPFYQTVEDHLNEMLKMNRKRYGILFGVLVAVSLIIGLSVGLC